MSETTTAEQHKLSVTRNAGLLAFYSLLIFLEGNFRASSMVSPISQGQTLSFPPEALLAGGLAGMAMGFAGFALAGALLCGVKVNQMAVFIVIGIEAVFGWFIFILFVFVNPAYIAYNTPGMVSPWPTRQLFNAFVTSGILVSAGYCICVLGTQFAATWSLLELVRGKDVQDAKYFRSRGITYSVVVAWTGLWILICGGIASNLDPGPLNVVSPPVFIVYSGYPIATGVIGLVTGLIGVVVGALPTRQIGVIIVGIAHTLNFFWQIGVMALYQPPVMGFPNASTNIAILIISQLIPAYFHGMRASVDGVIDVQLEPVMLSDKNN